MLRLRHVNQNTFLSSTFSKYFSLAFMTFALSFSLHADTSDKATELFSTGSIESVSIGPDQDICPNETTTLTASYTGETTCPLECTLGAYGGEQLIAYWNMSACESFQNDPSNYTYTELTSTNYNLPIASVYSTALYRTTGSHSCTNDANTNYPGDAVCVSMPDYYYQNNAPHAVRFNVTVNPSQGNAGITKLTFKEFAPSMFIWSQNGYTTNTGTNNYPTKFGIRVLKDGVEVYKQTNINTSTNYWANRTFDFSNIAAFKSTTSTTYVFELLAYSPIGNGAFVHAWDLDDIQVYGGACIPQTTNEVFYSWSTGSTAPTIDVAPSVTTTYSVTLTDCEGNTVSDQITINVKDADNDGVCDDTDCAPNDANFPTAPGTPCNDNDTNTSNDQILANGCDCAGIVITDIGDKVFYDLNNNGFQDDDEGGVENVIVRLVSAGNDGVFHTDDDVTEDGDISDENGNYLIVDVDPGTYTLEFIFSTLPENYIFTSKDNVLDDTKDSDVDASGKTDPFTITSGQANISDYDAGIISTIKGSIGDRIWEDLNGNGIQDVGEPGLKDVFVFLEDENENAIPGVSFELSDANGDYSFEDLPLGNYVLRFATPSGYTLTGGDKGENDAIDSDPSFMDGRTPVIELTTSNPDNVTVDGGYFLATKVNGFVWFDNNEDGLQDIDEPGVPNVYITLYNIGLDMQAGTADDIKIGSVLSGENGKYYFINVPPGEYYVNFSPITLPSDHEFTIPNEGTDDMIDSDANKITGNTSIFTVTSGTPVKGIDAGVVHTISLPVELISFDLELLEGDKVLLEWATAWEQDNNYFEIQRSTDGNRFETIGSVGGQGTSNSINDYKFIDEAPFYGRNYYRLLQIDYDGTTDLSEVRSLIIDNETLPDVIAYPNPTKDITTLRVVTPFEVDATVEIVNAAGQVLEVIMIEAGTNSQQIDLTKYQAGFYFLNIKYDGFRKLVHRVLKVRD